MRRIIGLFSKNSAPAAAPAQNQELSPKINIYGESGVGVSSVIDRLMDKDFSDAHMPTLSPKNDVKHIGDGCVAKVTLSQCPGLDSPHFNVAQSYMRVAHAVVLVCDLTKPMNIDQIREQIRKITMGDNVPVILAGNKSDVSTSEQRENFKRIAEQLKLPNLIVSARTNDLGNLQSMMINKALENIVANQDIRRPRAP